MKNKKLVTGGIIVIILTTLGFGLWKMRKREENVSNIRSDRRAQKRNEEVKEEVIENKVTKESTDQPKKVNYSDPDKFLRDIISKEIHSGKFTTPEEFLGNVIRIATISCSNDDWISYFPKNYDELKKLLAQYNLLKLFEVELYKNYVK